MTANSPAAFSGPFQTILSFFLSLSRFALFAVNSETQNNHVTDPAFTLPIKNVSVSVGREAVLSCFVENLQDFKVGWMRAADQTVLALGTRVVTHNSRYSVVTEEQKVWRLKIQNIREADRGCYM
jgi:Immunoglobulin I-set domain